MPITPTSRLLILPRSFSSSSRSFGPRGTVLESFEMPLLPLMTGGGYHFTGLAPLASPVMDRLARLLTGVPSWFATHRVRRTPWTQQAMDPRLARAYGGAGLLVEYLAHLIHRRAAPACRIPVVFNGTVVGKGLAGRECASIDFSYAGDPLDVRQVRVAFGAYQKHHFWEDVIGARVAEQVPPLVALPRQSEGLFEMLERGRHTGHGAQAAAAQSAEIPDVWRGLANLLEEYSASPLAAFHRDFYAVAPHQPSAWPHTYDRLEVDSLLPCVAVPLATPNDLLLQPARLQHLTRALMSEGWHPRHIAGLVHSRYARDFGWGTRWVTQMDAQTRARNSTSVSLRA